MGAWGPGSQDCRHKSAASLEDSPPLWVSVSHLYPEKSEQCFSSFVLVTETFLQREINAGANSQRQCCSGTNNCGWTHPKKAASGVSKGSTKLSLKPSGVGRGAFLRCLEASGGGAGPHSI